MVRTPLAHDVLVKASRLGGGGGQGHEPVPAVDVQAVGHGTGAVSRVDVAVALDRVLGPPVGLTLGTRSELGSRIELDVPQVVLVAALAVDELSEESVPDHLQSRHHVPPVADVLQHHARLFRGLGGVDEIPTFLQGDGRRHLDCDRLTRLHGRHGHGSMPAPGGGNHDGVQVLPRQELPEVVVVSGVYAGIVTSRIPHQGRGPVRRLGPEVADRVHLSVFPGQRQLQQVGSPPADADEPETDHPVVAAAQDGRPTTRQGCRGGGATLNKATPR